MKGSWKKLLPALAAAGLVLGSAALCGAGEAEEGKIRVVTTIFPEYDWAREILGEEPGNIELSLLLDNGVDMHSYQPGADDIVEISSCDVFVYVGGESDAWVEDVLSEAVNKEMKVVGLMELLQDSLKEEEAVPGMESAGIHEDHEDGETEYDEHVWLSLRNARTIVSRLAEVLGEADPEGADRYAANAEAYIEKLDALDAEYTSAVESGSFDTVLFADRFPFRYLTSDYGLSYYAAFDGCSAETEASFETVIFLAEKVDELGLHTILTTESKDQKMADLIAGSTKSKDQTIAAMNSMQGITASDIEEGATYLSIMEENQKVLAAALA